MGSLKLVMTRTSVWRLPPFVCGANAIFFAFQPFFDVITNQATVQPGNLSGPTGPSSFSAMQRPSRSPCSATSSSHRYSRPISTSSTRVGWVVANSSSASSLSILRFSASVSSRSRTVFSLRGSRSSCWSAPGPASTAGGDVLDGAACAAASHVSAGAEANGSAGSKGRGKRSMMHFMTSKKGRGVPSNVNERSGVLMVCGNSGTFAATVAAFE